jgi:propane monooxygenase reductase subunit
MPISDITVELLNYDEDLLSRSIAVKEFAAASSPSSALTRDIRLLEVESTSAACASGPANMSI